MLGSKAVKHDAVSAELPICTDSVQNNLEKGMLHTLNWWVSLVFCKRKMENVPIFGFLKQTQPTS